MRHHLSLLSLAAVLSGCAVKAVGPEPRPVAMSAAPNNPDQDLEDLLRKPYARASLAEIEDLIARIRESRANIQRSVSSGSLSDEQREHFIRADAVQQKQEMMLIQASARKRRDMAAQDAGPAPSATPPAQPATKSAPTAVLAVFDIEDVSKKLEADMVSQLTEFLSSRLAEIGYKIVPRDQLRAQLGTAKAESYKECYDQSCQIELGKAVAAEKMLQTKMLRVGSSCVVTSTLYDLKSETTDGAATARTTCEADAILSGIDRIVTELSKK